MNQIELDTETIEDAKQLIQMALNEDVEGGIDITSWATIPESVSGSANFVAREKGIVCGIAICQLIIENHGPSIQFQAHVHDGDQVEPGQTLATISGTTRRLLTLERTCLNFLGRLSGIATLTRRFVDKTKGTNAKILDTRKTTPGWRRLEKFAVQSGGGANHRMGLFDAILIKDNHLAMCGELSGDNKRGIREILKIANEWKKANAEQLPKGLETIIQLEVDSLEQFEESLDGDVDIVLLDNMGPDRLGEAVRMRNERAPQILLEASGGVNLETVAAIAQTGVDRISIGALTHSATNFDIGLDWSQSSN